MKGIREIKREVFCLGRSGHDAYPIILARDKLFHPLTHNSPQYSQVREENKWRAPSCGLVCAGQLPGKHRVVAASAVDAHKRDCQRRVANIAVSGNSAESKAQESVTK